MGKFYAVKKGLVPGIYSSWDECKANVNGYPGAVYKSFGTPEEAEAYLGVSNKTKPTNTTESTPTVVQENPDKHLVAYVDGSYDVGTNTYSYAAVILLPNGQKIYLSDIGRDAEASTMRNVAGEILASEKAMLFCLNNGYNSIEIFHDYQGISSWCEGDWKADNRFTQEYKHKFDIISEKISVSFNKVKGHSGNELNDEADALAKSAIDIYLNKN